MSFETYRGKRVFLTGHTGFKGSWFELWLKKIGADIFAYSLPEESGPATYSALGISSILNEESIADLRNEDALEEFYKKAKPDIVFHLAAQSLVRRSFTAPIETIETNILGTARVLECIRKFGGVGVIITSDKCYENIETLRPYVEEDPMGGHDVYSMSKGVCELMVSAYRRSFRVSVASARAGNVIGGGDFSEDRILPDCVRAIMENRSVLLRNPASLRPWQHVLEPLHGYLTLGEKLLSSERERFCEAWNFGPVLSDRKTVKELTSLFFEFYGQGKMELDHSRQHPHEAKFLCLSIKKAQEKLSWNPKWSLDTSLRMTALWYKEFLRLDRKKGSMRDISIQQIEEYMQSSGGLR